MQTEDAAPQEYSRVCHADYERNVAPKMTGLCRLGPGVRFGGAT